MTFTTRNHLFIEHEQFTLESGSAVHKWVIGSPRGLLLLQHGFGEYAERYVDSHSAFVPRLNALGIEVWAIDLQGHGSSPGNGSTIDVKSAVDDHIQVRRQARASGLPLFLFGHSLGGLITAGSTAHDTPGISGVILSSPAFAAPETPKLVEGTLELLAWIAPSMSLPKPRTQASKLVHGAERIKSIEDDPKLLRGQISCMSATTVLRMSRFIWSTLDQWRVPTLVLHGTSDVAARFEISERFVGMIASLDKLLHLDGGGYHELLCDSHSEQVLEVIIQWLNAHI